MRFSENIDNILDTERELQLDNKNVESRQDEAVLPHNV